MCEEPRRFIAPTTVAGRAALRKPQDPNPLVGLRAGYGNMLETFMNTALQSSALQNDVIETSERIPMEGGALRRRVGGRGKNCRHRDGTPLGDDPGNGLLA